MKKLIVFTDCGDTIIDEGSQVFDDAGNVLKADCIENADEVYKILDKQKYRMALVADGRVLSFNNLLGQHQLLDCFEEQVVSETIGVEKPDELMFEAAMKSLNLQNKDKSKVVMIGNNLERDIAGANRFGITSIWLRWSDRYPKVAKTADEMPDYTINHPKELIPLLSYLESLI